jgi:hypothetical protein
MALRLCPRALPSRLSALGTPRHFTSFVKTVPPPRIIIQPRKQPIPPSSLFLRRNLFGFRKRPDNTASDTATKAARSLYEICYQFTVYSGIFVIAAIAGFFIYDVFFPVRGRWIDKSSHKHITQGANERIFKFLTWLLIHDDSDQITSRLLKS